MIGWPGYNADAWHAQRAPSQPSNWFGSLIADQRDASALLYRRNRVYDPATGRFTQEDPIGLAGGVNTYGFGGGDAVNYSDPYGLRVCFDGNAQQRSRLEVQTERAIGTGLDVGSDGCVTRVGASGGAAAIEFRSLVDSDDRYSIAYGVEGEGSQYKPFSREIIIDPQDYLQPIYTWERAPQGRRCSFARGPYAFGATFGSDARIIAHELGHAFEHKKSGFWFYFRTRTRDEYDAIVWENQWARAHSEPERCRYSREF
jgi:RHS repeat-associated protein